MYALFMIIFCDQGNSNFFVFKMYMPRKKLQNGSVVLNVHSCNEETVLPVVGILNVYRPTVETQLKD